MKKIFIALISIGALLVLLFLADEFIFSKGERGPGGHAKPPADPEQRKVWLSENVDNNNHDEFISLDYQVPSWKELNKINKSLAGKTNYPNFIKAIQTYGTLPNLIEVLYFGDELKDLGVNTQFINANYWLKDGEFKLWYLAYDEPHDLSQDEARRALVHNILLAKQQGLAVILFPDYFQLEDGGMHELNIYDDLETRLETITLDLAQIAEEYNVEYLVPVNQIEMILSTNGFSVEETQERTNTFYANVVPKVRKVYSGKVFYKLGGFSDWDNYEGISLAGADIFGVTNCHRTPEPDTITSEMKESSEQASKMSKKYGVPWINAEFVVNNAADQQSMYGQVKTNYPIEDNYKIGLGAFDQYGTSAVGFTVHSLFGSGKVYDTPAWPLIKDFFAKK